MESDELKTFSTKCRCCLRILEDQQKLCIGEIVREKFFEMTQFELLSSTKLPQFICYNCFSILSRYSAMKKGFVENQKILVNLLKKSESLQVNDLYVKVEAIHEHKSSKLSESQDVIALRNPEELYHVEEFDDKQVKVELKTIDRTIFCDICNKIFTSQRTLKDHTSRIHLKVKKHHCNHCQYSCFSSYELKCHKNSKHRKHSANAKKYRCDQCALRFSQQSCLVRHKKANHMKM
ncbi:zinc finger protein 813-like [Chironomus tepperi]|uniref:zinc finger protein 813-like n=1 Tax=Chironomus tepperi TaxID=113505 RepID=UPI00391F2016